MGVAENRLPAAVRTRSAGGVADYLAPTLILLAPLLHFLEHHGYGLLRVESALLLLPLAVVGLLASAVIRNASQPVRVLVISTLLATFLNLRGVYGFFEMLVACAIVAWLLREHLTTVLAVGFSVLIATTYAFSTHDARARDEFPQPPASAAQQALPPILHLVLDEHIGVEGLPQGTALGRTVKSELKAFYADYGFRLHGGAYSQYFKTYDSLSNLFNFTSAAENSRYFPPGKDHEPYVLSDNRYFQELAARGYRFRIYQSHYMDFCSVPDIQYLSCSHYGNTIKAVESLDIAATQKALFIVNSFLQSSSTARYLRRRYDALRLTLQERDLHLPMWDRGYRVGLLALPPTLRQLQDDLREEPAGTVFFAHLLLPHYPYVFRPDCTVQDEVSEWLSRKSDELEAPLNNSPESRATRYQRYFVQLRCQQKILDEILQTMRTAGVLDSATVVLHGDHGSRISLYDPLAEYRDEVSDDDVVDHYSAMFAIKSPQVDAGYSAELQPLQNLLAGLMQHPPPVDENRVYLLDERYGPMYQLAIDGATWTRM